MSKLTNIQYSTVASVTAPGMIGKSIQEVRYTMFIAHKPEVIHDQDDVDASVSAIAIVREREDEVLPETMAGSDLLRLNSVAVEFLHEEDEPPTVLDALRDNEAVEVLLQEISPWFKGSAVMRTVTMSALFQAAMKTVE